MVATFIGAANAPTSGDSQASSRAVTKPADAQVAVFFACFWIGDGDTTITPPNGAVLRNNTVVGDARTATYLKYVDGDSTGATYTFSFSPGSKWSALKAVFFADIDDTLDLATVPFNTANAGGTGYATATVTTVTDAALVWGGNAAEYSSAPTHTPPTSFTETGDTDMSASAYRISPGDGSQSASGAATSGSISNKISTLVALAPAAGVGETVTLAGALPALTGSFDATASVDVELSGVLPSLDGSLTVDATATAALAGTLPTLTGDFGVTASADVELAGQLPAFTGSFTVQAVSDAALAGTLPSLIGSFTVATTADATLAGALPALTGSFQIVESDLSAVTLDGVLPALTGSFDGDATAQAALVGTLPALTGSFTIATEITSVTLTGTLPQLVGALASDASADIELGGTLPTLAGGFDLAASVDVQLIGVLPALLGGTGIIADPHPIILAPYREQALGAYREMTGLTIFQEAK